MCFFEVLHGEDNSLTPFMQDKNRQAINEKLHEKLERERAQLQEKLRERKDQKIKLAEEKLEKEKQLWQEKTVRFNSTVLSMLVF